VSAVQRVSRGPRVHSLDLAGMEGGMSETLEQLDEFVVTLGSSQSGQVPIGADGRHAASIIS
jgi:hypothetical protein